MKEIIRKTKLPKHFLLIYMFHNKIYVVSLKTIAKYIDNFYGYWTATCRKETLSISSI